MHGASVMALVALVVGCGGSSGGVSGGDLPSNSKPLTDLTSDEKKALCDWVAQKFGGYDSRGVCADGATAGLQGPTDPSECLDMLAGYTQCSITAGDVQSCVSWQVANACASPLPPSPECAVFQPGCGRVGDAGSSE